MIHGLLNKGPIKAKSKGHAHISFFLGVYFQFAFDIPGVLNEIGKKYLKKLLGKNENSDLRDMVRSTSKSERRRVKVSLHSKRFRGSSLNNLIVDSLATQALSRQSNFTLYYAQMGTR